MALPTQTIGGLASGMDTNSIISSLVNVEKTTLKRLETKKEKEELYLQAYYSVNSLLKDFLGSVEGLAKESMWKTKGATSSNDGVLSASVTENALPGTYSFKVGQLATNSKYMSSGFSSMDNPVQLGGANGATVAQPANLYTLLSSLNNGAGVDKSELFLEFTDASGNPILDLSGNAAKFSINPAALASCNTIADVMAVISGAASQSGFSIRAIDNGDGSFAIAYSPAVVAKADVEAKYAAGKFDPTTGSLVNSTVVIGDQAEIFSVLDGSSISRYDYTLDSFYENVVQKSGGWFSATGATIDFDATGLDDDYYFADGGIITRSAFETAANAAGFHFVKDAWSNISDGMQITSSNLVDGGGNPLVLTYDEANKCWEDTGGNTYSSFKFQDDGGNEITAALVNNVWTFTDSAGAKADFTLNGNTHAFTAAHWENSANVPADSFAFTGTDGKTYAYFAKGMDEATFAAMAGAVTASSTGTWSNTGNFTGILTAEQVNSVNALAEAVGSGKLSLVDLQTALQTPQGPGSSWQDRADAFDDVIANSGVLSSGIMTATDVANIAAMYDQMLQSGNTTAFDSALNAVGSGATAKDVRDGFLRSARAASSVDLTQFNNGDSFWFYADDGKIINAAKDASGDWSFLDTGGNQVSFAYNGENFGFTPDSAGLSHRNDYLQKETVSVKPAFKLEVDGVGDVTWQNIDNGAYETTTQTAVAQSALDGVIQAGQTVAGFKFTGATAASLGIDTLTVEADANGTTKNAVNSLYNYIGTLDATRKAALFSALGAMTGTAASGAADATAFVNALDAAGYDDATYHQQRSALLSAFGAMNDAERQAVIGGFQVSDANRAKTAFLNAAADVSSGSFKAAWNPGMAMVQEKGQQGYLTIENSGGQAVRNVLVSELNGGAGIYHGSIELTNKAGTRTIVDLSTAATLNDVLDRINAAPGIGVRASLNDNGDGIKLTDYSGGSGTLAVYNSGLGTTATDLGLTTLDANGNGANINKLTEKTQLAMLRNGMGINDGELGNMVINCDGKDYIVEAQDCGTIGDLIWAMQNAKNSDGEKLSAKAGIALENNRLVMTSVYRVAVISDISEDQSNTTAEDLGLVTGNTAYQRVEGLALTSSLNSVALYNVTGKRTFDGETNLAMFGVAAGETLTVEDKTGGIATFTATADSTLADLMKFFNDSGNGANVAMYLEPDRGSIALGDLSSVTDAARSITATGSMAAKLGFDATHNSASGSNNGVRGAQIYFAGIAGMADNFVRDAATGKLTANLGSVKMTVGATDFTLDLSAVKTDSSMSDLLKTLNAQAAAQIGAGKISFQLNSAKNGIEVVNNSGQNVSFKNDGVSTARDLGLDTVKIAGGATGNAGNLDTKWLGRAYSLEKLTGQSAVSGSISIINTHGSITSVDLTGCKTVGEVLDAINDSGSGVFASINDTGDGILLTDTYGGLGAISVSEVAGGALAKQLGLLGSSGGAMHNGSFQRDIQVNPSDSLRDLMNKISESGLDISASIINDGSGSAPYRLTISSRSSGYGSEFAIDTNLDALGLTQTSKGQDAVILYGESSGLSTMLLSNTNSNDKAILGVTLNASKVSDEWTTITVKQEKEQAVEAVQALVDSYNAILSMVNQYNQYDQETKQKGIFFGDANVRRLVNQMQEMFFTVTENKSGGYNMWYDLGVKFKDDGTLELDKETLQTAVNGNYDAVFSLLVKSVNVANAAGGTAAGSNSARGSITAGPTITTTGKAASGFDRLGASNGDKTYKSFGNGNGFCAAEPFGANYPLTENGNTVGSRGYMYEVLFDKTRTLDKVYIYHVDSEDMPADKYALKDFKVEYLDPNTNEWKELRTITDNASNANYLGFAMPTAAKGVRINATSTNADDGLFRLTEIECYESQGLASNMLQNTKLMTDIIDGWFAGIQSSMEDKINRLSSDIEKENTRLETYESNLIKKYANMETVMSKLQSQSATIDSYINTSSKK